MIIVGNYTKTSYHVITLNSKATLCLYNQLFALSHYVLSF